MSGIGIIAPANIEFGHGGLLFGHSVISDEADQETAPKMLLESAKSFLKEAGIKIPFASLKLKDDAVVMQGVPDCGDIIVCAVRGSSVQNCL